HRLRRAGRIARGRRTAALRPGGRLTGNAAGAGLSDVPLESEGLLSGLRVPHLHLLEDVVLLALTLAQVRGLPSGLKAMLRPGRVWPLRVRVYCPVCASHTLTVVSALPEARRLPSGENATLQTTWVCPLRVRVSLPVCASHTFTSPGMFSRM